MNMDALMAWWADPDAEIIPAGETDRIIDWLRQQTPETWHCVTRTWNFDHGDKVLRWLLDQDNCDKGTAAWIFLVEGFGHWIGDADLADDENHLCNIVLRNWPRYQTGRFAHDYEIPDWGPEAARKLAQSAPDKAAALNEIISYTGAERAQSEFGSEDGKIVVALEHWAKAKGYKLD